MSRNLIINKLNKCNAYEFKQKAVMFEDNSNSKISTSTKTQQSPTAYNLNPEFTFKGKQLTSILNKKSQSQLFFDNFQTNNQVIYQKVILIKPKPIQRTLQFELISLQSQVTEFEIKKLNRKLEYPLQQKQISSKKQQNKIQQSHQLIKLNNQITYVPEYVKTEYQQNNMVQPHQEYLFNNNAPYDSKKYKLTRDKKPFKQVYLNNGQSQKCQTQSDCYQVYPTYSDLYQSKRPQNQFRTQISEFEEKQNNFNNYYFQNNHQNDDIHNRNQSQNRQNANFQKHIRKLSNSSRLTLFRKQREYHMRKSLLQQNNNSRRDNYCSNDNKQNISSNMKGLSMLPLNNLSQVAQKKLKNQYSERYLLGKGHIDQQKNQNRVSYQNSNLISSRNMGSSSYLNKQTQLRLQSILKQLKDVYDGKERQKSKLKIMRDQETYDNNARNTLRRVGSICRF